MKLKKQGLEVKEMNSKSHVMISLADLKGIDADNDSYERGAFMKNGEQWATILAGHSWLTVPLGKARVFEDGDLALAEMHLNLKTTTGRDWYEAIKFDYDGCDCGKTGKSVQEYSYGFYVKDSMNDIRDGKQVRILKDVQVYEISPVVQGAGVGTGTLSVKGAKLTDERFNRVSDDLVKIAEAVSASPETISQAGRAQLKGIHGGLEAVLKALDVGGEDLSRQEKDDNIALSNAFMEQRNLKQIGERLRARR